ncbi:MAG: response regulator [Anaerolineae bacterium]|nr:response regulator [Anaerolineae bacterium]
MMQSPPTYQIEVDFEEDRLDRLRLLLYLTMMLSALFYGTSLLEVNGGIWLWPVIFVVAVLLLALIQRHLTISAWIFTLTMMAVPIYYLSTGELNIRATILVLLPVIAASLVHERDAVLWTGIITLIVCTFVAIFRFGLTETWLMMPLPILICIFLIVSIYWMQQSLLDLVHWSTDVQQKDTRRAELFYAQKEQLEDALLQLKFANDKLERLNDDLDAAQRVAENASRAKSIFLSNMSHELRTPLNVIIGYTSSMLNMPQMFDNRRLPSAYRPYIQLVEESGHYLLGLINDVLDLSKIEAGKLELHCSPMALPDLMRGVLTTSIALLKDKKLSLLPDFPDDIPFVWGDPMRVRQILLNLMSNAVKFTETGSVTLAARVEGDHVHIAVRDTGIGIPESVLESIFDRFQQASSDTDRRYGGTGLGLDISRRLVNMHGGELRVESVVNQGSVFTFTLPLATEAQTRDVFGPALADASITIFDENEEELLQAQTALVVEDETANRKLACGVLESAGFIVIETHEGAEALELASGLIPDVILLDLSLPDIDGWEVLRRLRAQPETQAIPVVLFSGYPWDSQAGAAGAAGYIEKPATSDEILQGVKAALALNVH